MKIPKNITEQAIILLAGEVGADKIVRRGRNYEFRWECYYRSTCDAMAYAQRVQDIVATDITILRAERHTRPWPERTYFTVTFRVDDPASLIGRIKGITAWWSDGWDEDVAATAAGLD